MGFQASQVLSAFLVLLVFLSTPFLLANFAGFRILQWMWLWIMSIFYPNVEFIRESTVRSLTETRRNQGIVTVLLTVRGVVHLDLLRRHLTQLINRTDKQDRVVFPKLRQCLVSPLGTFGWLKAEEGEPELDSNFIVSCLFRGRAVTSKTIQEHASDIVAKYLPSDKPPWQLVVIPRTDHCHCLLLRVHHMLLSSGGLSLADFIPWQALPSPASASAIPTSPLLLRPIQAIPELRDRLAEDCANYWNELVSSCDPLERPELLKEAQQSLPQFLVTVVICVVAAFKDWCRTRKALSPGLEPQVRFFVQVLRKEAGRRKITQSQAWKSLRTVFNPRHLLRWSVTLGRIAVLQPWRELSALYHWSKDGHRYRNHSIVSALLDYLPSVLQVGRESLDLSSTILSAPAVLYKELVNGPEVVNARAICGRKVVSWSKPISIALLENIGRCTNSTPSEILLASAVETLSEMTECAEFGAVARHLNPDYVFAPGRSKMSLFGGSLCMRLSPCRDPLDQLSAMKELLGRVRRQQSALYYLSLGQTRFGAITSVLPSVVVVLLANHLSRQYTVSITEVSTPNGTTGQKRKMAWGQEVDSVLYWRPPQANISVSLCLNFYGSSAQVAVMCDAQLTPHHAALPKAVADYVDKLSRAVK